MKEKILAMVEEIANGEGTERRSAMRDLLTICIHVCEEEGWSFARTIAGAIEVFKEEQEIGVQGGDAQRGSYKESLDHCPLCGTDNICNEDSPDDAAQIEITCHNCGYQWVEPG